MKNLGRGILTIAFFLLILVAHKTYAVDTNVAEKAAASWLALVDAENYNEAWKGFSTSFKSAMTQEKWEVQVKSARSIFGKLVERKFKNATATKSLPGAPDGDYVIVQYDSTFEKKKMAVETVTVALEKDGKWGVAGYYIR